VQPPRSVKCCYLLQLAKSPGQVEQADSLKGQCSSWIEISTKTSRFLWNLAKSQTGFAGSPKTSRFDLIFLKIWKNLKKTKTGKPNRRLEKPTGLSFFIQNLDFK
jgi:hypothetical protein